MPKELTIDDFREAAGKSIFPIRFNDKGEVIDLEIADFSGDVTPKHLNETPRFTYPDGADAQPTFICE